jgi:hypothetical protein
LSTGLSYSQSINSPLHHDKQKHILVGAGIGLATLAFTKEKTDFQRVLIASGVSFGIASGYELYQYKTNTGTVEAFDVVYTVAGSALSSFVTLKVNKWIRRKY